MMISWIREHEVGREAFLKVGFQPFMTALIKIHVYGSFGEFLDDVKVKEVREMMSAVATSVTPWQIFIILLKYSWNFPQGILDLFTNPHYHTQPPLQLRLALLPGVVEGITGYARESSNTYGKKKGCLESSRSGIAVVSGSWF